MQLITKTIISLIVSINLFTTIKRNASNIICIIIFTDYS